MLLERLDHAAPDQLEPLGRRRWIRLRNLNYKLLPYLPWRKVIEELPLKAGNAITLKEYAGAPV